MSDKFAGGILAGSTSVSMDVLIRKASDNTALTGLAFNTAGNIASYHRQGAARTAITLATQTVTGAFSSGGFVEIDATNQPGLYRLDIPDAALATGVDFVTITLVTTSGYVFHERLSLTTNVVQTGDNFARIGALGAGLTAIPGMVWTDIRAGYKGTGTGAGGTAGSGATPGTIILASGAGAALAVKPGDYIISNIDGVPDANTVASISTDTCTMDGPWGGGVAPDNNDPYYVFAGGSGQVTTTLAAAFFAYTLGAENGSLTYSQWLRYMAARILGNNSGLTAGAGTVADLDLAGNAAVSQAVSTDGNRSGRSLS